MKETKDIIQMVNKDIQVVGLLINKLYIPCKPSGIKIDIKQRLLEHDLKLYLDFDKTEKLKEIWERSSKNKK